MKQFFQNNVADYLLNYFFFFLQNSTDSEDINVMLTAFKNTDGPAQSTSAPEESKDSPSTSGVFSNK